MKVRRPVWLILHSSFFILHFEGPQGVRECACLPAKQEARGANPRGGAISQDCGVTSSISPREGDGPGANPGFLTTIWPGPKITGSEVQG